MPLRPRGRSRPPRGTRARPSPRSSGSSFRSAAAVDDDRDEETRGDEDDGRFDRESSRPFANRELPCDAVRHRRTPSVLGASSRGRPSDELLLLGGGGHGLEHGTRAVVPGEGRRADAHAAIPVVLQLEELTRRCRPVTSDESIATITHDREVLVGMPAAPILGALHGARRFPRSAPRQPALQRGEQSCPMIQVAFRTTCGFLGTVHDGSTELEVAWVTPAVGDARLGVASAFTRRSSSPSGRSVRRLGVRSPPPWIAPAPASAGVPSLLGRVDP